MKRVFNILLAAACLFTVFACDVIPRPDTEPDGSQYLAGPALDIVSKDLFYSPQGGTGTIVLNTTETVYATSSRPWIKVSVNGGRVTLTVDRNEGIESRYASITLQAGDAAAELVAQQFGINSAYMWDESYTFPYQGGELTLPYGEAGTVKVWIDETKWIAAEVDETTAEIHFTVAKSIFNYERTGKVTVEIGDNYTREITFIQEANPAGLNPGEEEPMEFIIESAWKPYYVIPESNDQDYSTVGVEVTEGSHAGRYFIKVVPASEFSTTDPDELQLYLNRHAPEWAAASPLIHRASAEEVIDALPMGNYVVGAIGVDNDNKVNGSVAFTVFSVTKVLTPYEKFLGTWSFVRNKDTGTEDVWTFTEKVKNASYTVTGIDGDEITEVTAVFNPEDGTVSVSVQENLREKTVNTNEGEKTGPVSLYGRINYNGTLYYVTGSYTIFTISLNQDASVGTLTPGAVKVSIGDFTLAGFALFTVVGESAYSVTDQSMLPGEIHHLTWAEGGGSEGGGGGGGDDPDPSAYGKWIGTWTIEGNEFTIAADEQDVSYSIRGFADFEVKALFNKADGKLWFVGQSVAEDDQYQYVFAGRDSEQYMELGDSANQYLLATASLSADGKSASIVTHEYDAVYSGTSYHEIIVMMTIWGIPQDETDEYVYTFNNVPKVTVPSEMTKASSASVMSLRNAAYDLRTGQFIPIYKTFKAGSAVPYKRR